jgi:N-acetylneuraminic acid mutarotase
VFYTPVRTQLDYTLESWISATSMPSSTYSHSAVAWNGYLYIIGGRDAANAATSTVISAPLYTSCTTFTTNAPPTVSAVSINNGDPIVPIAATTTPVYVNFTVTDGNGCSDVFTSGNVTTTLYRSGVGSSCSASNLNCYITATVTSNSCVGTSTSANATATLNVWYFAQSTSVESSSFPLEYWMANVQVRDSAGESSSSASAASTTRVNVLAALAVSPSSTNYGSLYTNANTGALNQVMAVQNAGNSTTTLQISGTALTYNGNSIATSSQHYATSSFIFTVGGSEQVLSSTLQDVVGSQISSPLIQFPQVPSWATSTALPFAITSHPSFAYNGYAYVVGGYVNSKTTSTVLFGPISSTGSISNWSTTTALPFGYSNHPSFAYNGYAYVVGGYASTTDWAGVTSTVLKGLISSTGSIAYWTSTTQLPFKDSNHPSFAYNGYVYVVGGYANGALTSTVLYGPISSTGSIAYWTSTTALPFTDNSHPSFAYNGYAYVVGGVASGTATSTVLFGPISSTGSIAYWTSTAVLPFANSYHPSFAYNGYAYVVGGWYMSTVLFGPISSTGSIAYWTSTTALPFTDSNHPSFAYNGYAYVVGGNANGLATTTVLFAPLGGREMYWGASAPGGISGGQYSGVVTYTAVFTP